MLAAPRTPPSTSRHDSGHAQAQDDDRSVLEFCRGRGAAWRAVRDRHCPGPAAGAGAVRPDRHARRLHRDRPVLPGQRLWGGDHPKATGHPDRSVLHLLFQPGRGPCGCRTAVCGCSLDRGLLSPAHPDAADAGAVPDHRHQRVWPHSKYPAGQAGRLQDPDQGQSDRQRVIGSHRSQLGCRGLGRLEPGHPAGLYARSSRRCCCGASANGGPPSRPVCSR